MNVIAFLRLSKKYASLGLCELRVIALCFAHRIILEKTLPCPKTLITLLVIDIKKLSHLKTIFHSKCWKKIS